MRNFIFDVWVWSKAKHSRLLKQIRVTTEIPINQAYIGGDTANISINVII